MKKLKQTLGKDETKKTKNINLSYSMIPGKKSLHDHNPAYLYVRTLYKLEISWEISNLIRSWKSHHRYCVKLFQEQFCH